MMESRIESKLFALASLMRAANAASDSGPGRAYSPATAFDGNERVGGGEDILVMRFWRG